MRDTDFVCAVLMALTFGILSGPALAEASGTEIKCQANEEYYLCEAHAAGPVDHYSWSVSDELHINLVSGPLVSVGCPSGKSGVLRLEMEGSNDKKAVSLHLDCP